MSFLSTQWSRHFFCCQVTWTLRTASSGVPSPLITAKAITLCEVDCQGCHLQTWHHWTILVRGRQPSDMSRCLASSGQHLVDGEGSSGSSTGSSKMVPPTTPQTNHWHGYSSVSLTDWSAAGVTRSGRRIHRTGIPQIFICGDTLRTGCMATTPDYPWPEGSNHSSNKSDPKGGMREGHREICPPDPNVPAALGSSFGAHFLSASETKSFCSTDSKLWRCLAHRHDLM